MGIFDLFLILSVFLVLLGGLGMLVALIARRWCKAGWLGLGLAVYIGGYAALLVGAALLSPQKVLPMHQARCFDDWCASVEQVKLQPSIGDMQAQGVFYVVTVQVSSRAKRVSQRELDAAIYLLDERGKRYDPSPRAQQALEAAGQAGMPLDSRVEAGGSFTYTTVFDLPQGITPPGLVISHGEFPGIIVIGDDQSLLHQPTIMRLSVP
jgi:hypothetical protein